MVTWVPRKLAPQIRCIFSMIPDTPQHTALMGREPQPKVLEVVPLDLKTREVHFSLLYFETLSPRRSFNILYICFSLCNTLEDLIFWVFPLIKKSYIVFYG